MEINTADPVKFDRVETQFGSLTFQRGWNMFGVYSDANGTQLFNVMPDGTTSSSAIIKHTATQFVDDNQYIICIGGRRYDNNGVSDSLDGMVYQLNTYFDKITLADVLAEVSFT